MQTLIFNGWWEEEEEEEEEDDDGYAGDPVIEDSLEIERKWPSWVPSNFIYLLRFICRKSRIGKSGRSKPPSRTFALSARGLPMSEVTCRGFPFPEADHPPTNKETTTSTLAH